MFARVLAALNEETRIAIIDDETLADEVPGFKVQSTCYRARQRLQELGYWRLQEGRGHRATRYEILEEPTKAVLEAIAEAKKRRIADREKRGPALKRPNRSHAAVQGKDGIQPCKSLSSSHAAVQVVHPQGTPSGTALRSQDVTQEAMEPAHRCLDCWGLATWEGRYKDSDQTWLSCDDCLDGMALNEHWPIGARELSRGELAGSDELDHAPELDAATNYRRASRG